MNVWIVIVWLMTAEGPREIRQEFQSGRACEAVARDLNLRPPPLRGAVFMSARCVPEYEA